jgi:hypothetical protein
MGDARSPFCLCILVICVVGKRHIAVLSIYIPVICIVGKRHIAILSVYPSNLC